MSIHRLAQLIHVSEPTLRRDLTQMENQGLLHRTYGGAVLPDRREYAPLALRLEDNAPAKKKIAAQAAAMVRKGSVIFLDSSSTVQNMLHFFNEKQELTVISNSLAVCQRLVEMRIRTYCVGGLIDEKDNAMRGKYAEAFIRSVHIDQAFFSCSSLSREGCLGGHHERGVAFLQSLLQQSRERIFLCTLDKLGRDFMHVICTLGDVDAVLCDQPLPPELLKMIGKNR